MITANQLKQRLESEFDLKIFCDLGVVSQSPVSLFQLLTNAYQASYEVNQRIVFYTSSAVPLQLLQHLYETANDVDISNWFILICGPASVEHSVITACKEFSSDVVPFQFCSVDLSETLPIVNQFWLPKTICALPWTNLEITSNGDITPCCKSKNLILGNVKNTTLIQAFHGTQLQQLRDQLLAGQKPTTCENCWEVEDRNLTSIRQHNIKRLKTDFMMKYFDKPELSTLDIKFNNTCNFKCRICGPGSSSLFAEEQHKFRKTPLILQDNWSEDENFINQVIDHLPNITNIDMYGGEPFLIKKFKKVLKLASENGYAQNIRLHYNSNGSVWPEHLLPYWKNFNFIDLHFSIDSIDNQFELERGGSWKEVESNILRLRDLAMPNLSISIMPTIGAMNVYYIDKVYDWANAHGFPIFVNYTQNPGLELQDLTLDAKNLIIAKFKNHPWQEIQNIIKTIKELPDSDGLAFRNKIQWFDAVRKENFADSHYEIAKAMGYV